MKKTKKTAPIPRFAVLTEDEHGRSCSVLLLADKDWSSFQEVCRVHGANHEEIAHWLLDAANDKNEITLEKLVGFFNFGQLAEED